jgi:hypothetical protein
MLVSMKMAVFWVVARISEMLGNFYQTAQCYNPEDCYLQRVLKFVYHIHTKQTALLLWCKDSD